MRTPLALLALCLLPLGCGGSGGAVSPISARPGLYVGSYELASNLPIGSTGLVAMRLGEGGQTEAFLLDDSPSRQPNVFRAQLSAKRDEAINLSEASLVTDGTTLSHGRGTVLPGTSLPIKLEWASTSLEGTLAREDVGGGTAGALGAGGYQGLYYDLAEDGRLLGFGRARATVSGDGTCSVALGPGSGSLREAALEGRTEADGRLVVSSFSVDGTVRTGATATSFTESDRSRIVIRDGGSHRVVLQLATEG